MQYHAASMSMLTMYSKASRMASYQELAAMSGTAVLAVRHLIQHNDIV